MSLIFFLENLDVQVKGCFLINAKIAALNKFYSTNFGIKAYFAL